MNSLSSVLALVSTSEKLNRVPVSPSLCVNQNNSIQNNCFFHLGPFVLLVESYTRWHIQTMSHKTSCWIVLEVTWICELLGHFTFLWFSHIVLTLFWYLTYSNRPTDLLATEVYRATTRNNQLWDTSISRVMLFLSSVLKNVRSWAITPSSHLCVASSICVHLQRLWIESCYLLTNWGVGSVWRVNGVDSQKLGDF